MIKKALPVRLDPEVHERLHHLAELEGKSMVEVIRQALDAFLPVLAARHAERLEDTLARLRAYTDERRGHRAAIESAARAEVELDDGLEERVVVERRPRSKLTNRVLRAFGGNMG